MADGAAPVPTVAALWRTTAACIGEHGAVEAGEASRDARLLVAHACGLRPQDIVLHGDEPADREAAERAGDLARRRAAGAPVARLLGRRAFYDLELRVTAATLDPRPDSETVVDAALARVASRREAPLTILDLGTGTGALLLALLNALPQASGVGVDVSPAALAVARQNADDHGLSDRAAFAAGDWGAAIGRPFDIVVANPPYVRSGDIAGLAPEVRDHDPPVALDGGPDGLDAHRAIVAALPRLLAADGCGFLEIGDRQAEDVCALVNAAGLTTSVARDLGGRDRVVAVTREPPADGDP